MYEWLHIFNTSGGNISISRIYFFDQCSPLYSRKFNLHDDNLLYCAWKMGTAVWTLKAIYQTFSRRAGKEVSFTWA